MEGRNRIQHGSPDKDASIISSIFSFDELDKVTLLNLIQYVTLSIIPILLVLKLLHEYVPEEDDEKSSIEVATELMIEVVSIVLSLWFINLTNSPYLSIQIHQYTSKRKTNSICWDCLWIA